MVAHLSSRRKGTVRNSSPALGHSYDDLLLWTLLGSGIREHVQTVEHLRRCSDDKARSVVDLEDVTALVTKVRQSNREIDRLGG